MGSPPFADGTRVCFSVRGDSPGRRLCGTLKVWHNNTPPTWGILADNPPVYLEDVEVYDIKRDTRKIIPDDVGSFWGGIKNAINPLSSPFSPIGQARRVASGGLGYALNPFAQTKALADPWRSGKAPRNILPGYDRPGAIPGQYPPDAIQPDGYYPPGSYPAPIQTMASRQPAPYSPLGTSQGYDWGQSQAATAAPMYDWGQYQPPQPTWDSGSGTGWESAYGEGQ